MESNDIVQTVGTNIRNLRSAKGMRQQELAQLCRMQKASICRIEAGDINISLDTLQRIAATLEVAPNHLFEPVP